MVWSQEPDWERESFRSSWRVVGQGVMRKGTSRLPIRRAVYEPEYVHRSQGNATVPASKLAGRADGESRWPPSVPMEQCGCSEVEDAAVVLGVDEGWEKEEKEGFGAGYGEW